MTLLLMDFSTDDFAVYSCTVKQQITNTDFSFPYDTAHHH